MSEMYQNISLQIHFVSWKVFKRTVSQGARAKKLILI